LRRRLHAPTTSAATNAKRDEISLDDAFLGTSEGWIALANGVVGDGRESALGDSQHDLAPMGSPGAFPATALAERLD
jgi:hypothetical protein